LTKHLPFGSDLPYQISTQYLLVLARKDAPVTEVFAQKFPLKTMAVKDRTGCGNVAV